MTFRLACGDVMPGCSARFESTDRDLLHTTRELATQINATVEPLAGELGLAIQILRRDVDVAHAHGVLDDDGGDGAHPVAAHRGDRLEVRVLAGAARGVGAGDGQDAGHAGGHGATSPAGTAAKARR